MILLSCPEKIDTLQKSHETVETLDTVVVYTYLENYAQSVSRVLTVSCKNPHVSFVSFVRVIVDN